MYISNDCCDVSRQGLREPDWITNGSHAANCIRPEYWSMLNLSLIYSYS